MSLLNDILRNAVTAKASDIHINVGAPPLYRVHTVVKPSDCAARVIRSSGWRRGVGFP